ncbi:unnamed protein product, partial [Laminaria digitata]
TGAIPKELGGLSELQQLHLGSNQLTGLIPPELGNLAALTHLYLEGNQLSGEANSGRVEEPRRLSRFQHIGLALDGPPLPAVDIDNAIKILILPVVLGYADLASDLYTAVSYYQSYDYVLFGLGLVFAVGPAIILSAYFLSGVHWFRRVLVATQLGLLFEAIVTFNSASDYGGEYSPVLALVRVVEPLFESVPQLLLQLYAMLRLWAETSSSPSRLGWRVVSVCTSAASLAYAATDLSSVRREGLQCAGFTHPVHCP